MKKTLLIVLFLSVSACAGKQPLIASPPIGISTDINGLQRSVCNCGGIESKEKNKIREKAKKEHAKNGTISTDVVQDN